MMFHSYAFVLGFLPICLAGFLLVLRLWGREAGLLWLAAASLYFYSNWGWQNGLFLVISIAGNYAFARALQALSNQSPASRTVLLGAVAANLGLLAYCKYMNFFVDNANAVFGTSFAHLQILLPVGISFYTFIQIGYLVEIYNGQARAFGLTRHVLFASFFPYVTAGPIVLQKDMTPQYENLGRNEARSAPIAIGLTVFAIGLFKKLVLADSIGPYANAVFDGAAGGAVVDFATSWIGALAYTLQLYFDFSGYSDMALGIGCMFGLYLPLNFNSPLKASSITDFWRRWHMTMTRFFTNYLFTPMAIARMRHSMRARHSHLFRFISATAVPAVYTFTLAGLWHGAGWTFVAFGLLHGISLAANHAWREWRLPALPASIGWLLTMSVVVTGMVLFRSDSLTTAGTLLGAMIGLGGWGNGSVMMGSASAREAVLLIGALGALVLVAPNTQQIMGRFWYSSDPAPAHQGPAASTWLNWQPSPGWALAAAVLVFAALSAISGDTSFLYYDF